MEKKYNLKSPAVKRLMREARELCEATEQYYAQPLEDNLFEWHFTVQGADDSDFESGRYHGRITLPPEYPMKPPSIILLTPNGRFETGKKICLSMSAHHPETWQPSWSIRTVLLAIIGFMPTRGGGAIGALDYTSEERKALAKKSLSWKCDVCGSCTIDALKEPEPGHQRTTNKEAEELALQINFKGENEKKSEKSTDAPDGVTSIFNSSLPDNSMNIPNGQTPESSVLAPSLAEVDGIDDVTSGAGGAEQSTDSGMRQRVQRRSSAKRISQSGRNVERTASERSSSSDYSSAILILILSVCFLLLLFRRIYKEYYLKTN